jgi:transcriptional regulator with XRE-family HTH domain
MHNPPQEEGIMSSIHAKLGKHIKELRKQKSISQQTLATMLDIPRPAISQIENGSRTISADELVNLSKIFGVTVESILELKSEPTVVLGASKQKKKKPGSQLRISVPQKNVEKFREVLLYILDKVGAKPHIGETVIYKLLYFMDFNYYEKYEEQLMGAAYQKNHYGPTPIEFSRIVEDMIEKEEVERVKSKYFEYPQTKYLPRRKPDLSNLTAKELEVIKDVLNRLSDMNAKQISNYSHNDVPWMSTADGELIEYESVFYRTPAYSVREYNEDAQ